MLYRLQYNDILNELDFLDNKIELEISFDKTLQQSEDCIWTLVYNFNSSSSEAIIIDSGYCDKPTVNVKVSSCYEKLTIVWIAPAIVYGNITFNIEPYTVNKVYAIGIRDNMYVK